MKRRVCRVVVLAATGWVAVGHVIALTVACRDNCEHQS